MTQPLASTPPESLPAHCLPNFFARAGELRHGFDAELQRRQSVGPPDSDIWDFWHLSGRYTLLRTNPRRLLPSEPLDALLAQIAEWGARNLNTRQLLSAFLSVYVQGCKQMLHNDALTGQFAFVYSLTDSDAHAFVGGETLLLRHEALIQPGALMGDDLYLSFEPTFNQLLVFDTRRVHAVETVLGTMDLHRARVVIHGMLR